MLKNHRDKMLMTSGWKHHRTYHLLSCLDIAFFYTLEWNDTVTEIKENYPLDHERIKQIMDNHNIF